MKESKLAKYVPNHQKCLGNLDVNINIISIGTKNGKNNDYSINVNSLISEMAGYTLNSGPWEMCL